MVRFHNAVVSILSESNTIDESGDYIAEWTQIETLEGDALEAAKVSGEETVSVVDATVILKYLARIISQF